MTDKFKMIPKFKGKSLAKENRGEWMYGNLIIDGTRAYIVNGIGEVTKEYMELLEWCPVDITTVTQIS